MHSLQIKVFFSFRFTLWILTCVCEIFNLFHPSLERNNVTYRVWWMMYWHLTWTALGLANSACLWDSWGTDSEGTEGDLGGGPLFRCMSSIAIAIARVRQNLNGGSRLGNNEGSPLLPPGWEFEEIPQPQLLTPSAGSWVFHRCFT